MKRQILFPILLTLFCQTIGAQSTNVLVYSEANQPFYLYLNGVSQNQTPATSLRVTGVEGTSLTSFILFADPQLGSLSNTLSFNKNTEAMFGISKGISGQNTLIWKGEIDIRLAGRPGPGMTIVKFNNMPPPDVGPRQVQGQINLLEGSGQQTQTTVTTTTSTTMEVEPGEVVATEPETYVLPGYNGPIGCSWPMTNSEFSEAKKSISSKTFDDSKLTIAKQITNSNCLLSDQIREIMQQFSFEDRKVEFAKFAYGHVFDKGNYYKVNDAFTYDSSIDELNEYIGSK